MTEKHVLPLSKKVIHAPSDDCPGCGASIFGDKVKLIASHQLDDGGWTIYECACRLVWRQYWPGIGRMMKLVRMRLAGTEGKKLP